MRGKNTLFSAAAILLLLGSPVFAYRQLIDLGTIGGKSSWAQSINDNGRVIGYSTSSFNTQACLFDQTGKGATSLWGNDSGAYSINNAGQIVGRALFVSFPPPFNSSDHACLFDSKNMMNSKDLGSLGGTISWARSINNNNQIVGYAYNSAERPRACLFDFSGNGANKDLGTLGGTDSIAYSINDGGIIVGSAYDAANKPHACLFDSSGGGANITLGAIGNAALGMAYSINNNNQIVGKASNGSNTHACLFDWTGGGANIDLGTLGGSTSEAWFINDIGQIVGWSSDSSNKQHACLFDSTSQGNNVDLNTLIDPASGWTLNYAYCINNSGWIVGQGTYNGYARAFLLTPEPASALLLAIGAALLRRKK